MINEQVKEKNQDKESWVLTNIHVPEEESLYFCISASFLSGMLLCTHACVHIEVPASMLWLRAVGIHLARWWKLDIECMNVLGKGT